MIEYLKGQGKSDNASAVDAMNTILPMLTDTLGVGKLGGAMAGGAALAAPAVGAGMQGALLSLLSRPEVIPAIIDSALAILDKSPVPPNSWHGYMSALVKNFGEIVYDNVKEYSQNEKAARSDKTRTNNMRELKTHSSRGVCTPKTQPRNDRGEFAPCEHEAR